jgi:hypothetical protein
MGVPFDQAAADIEAAAARLFDSDPRVRSVGVSRHEDAFGFRAVRNSAQILPLAVKLTEVAAFKQVPVTFVDTPGELESLVMVPGLGPASPAAASFIPEVLKQTPAVCGLQIQNFDDDVRQGVIAQGNIIIGTLGCFVRLAGGKTALLSNNHVVAGENRGKKGQDRIQQPGDGVHTPADQLGLLTDFVRLRPSPAGATVKKGNVVFNDVDAGVAQLDAGVAFAQGYLPSRGLIAPSGTASAKVGDRVFKVGRTTGLTFGEVKSVTTIVGPVPYDPGPCWFRRSIEIEGINGTMFSDRGDSGSAILRTSGEVVGILYAGNGVQTYACPIDAVLKKLKCNLA